MCIWPLFYPSVTKSISSSFLFGRCPFRLVRRSNLVFNVDSNKAILLASYSGHAANARATSLSLACAWIHTALNQSTKPTEHRNWPCLPRWSARVKRAANVGPATPCPMPGTRPRPSTNSTCSGVNIPRAHSRDNKILYIRCPNLVRVNRIAPSDLSFV